MILDKLSLEKAMQQLLQKHDGQLAGWCMALSAQTSYIMPWSFQICQSGALDKHTIQTLHIIHSST